MLVTSVREIDVLIECVLDAERAEDGPKEAGKVAVLVCRCVGEVDVLIEGVLDAERAADDPKEAGRVGLLDNIFVGVADVFTEERLSYLCGLH